MREEKAFLVCGLIVLVLLSSFGAANWRSKVGEIEFRTSAGLVYHAILAYQITNAENSRWESAKELIENDNCFGAVAELSFVENNLNSFADTIQFTKASSLLQDEDVYNNLAQLAQNLADRIASLIRDLQFGEVQKSSINRIDNEFENLSRLYFATFEQECYQITRLGRLWVANNAGQMIDIKYIQIFWNWENVGGG